MSSIQVALVKILKVSYNILIRTQPQCHMIPFVLPSGSHHMLFLLRYQVQIMFTFSSSKASNTSQHTPSARLLFRASQWLAISYKSDFSWILLPQTVFLPPALLWCQDRTQGGHMLGSVMPLSPARPLQKAPHRTSHCHTHSSIHLVQNYSHADLWLVEGQQWRCARTKHLAQYSHLIMPYN